MSLDQCEEKSWKPCRFEGPHRQQLEASFRELVRSGTKSKAERLATPLALTLRNIWLECAAQAKHKTHGRLGCFDDRVLSSGDAECAARPAGGDVGSLADHVAHAPMLATCDARFVMVIVWVDGSDTGVLIRAACRVPRCCKRNPTVAQSTGSRQHFCPTHGSQALRSTATKPAVLGSLRFNAS